VGGGIFLTCPEQIGAGKYKSAPIGVLTFPENGI